jgi:hypothetical protein
VTQETTNNSNNNNNNNNTNTQDREVVGTRPDIIIKNKKKTCLLIDLSIPADRNVTQREAEKKLKWKNLCVEIKRMWNMRCVTVPVIIGATGVVTKVYRKTGKSYQQYILLIYYKKQLYFERDNIIRKVPQADNGSLGAGSHHFFKGRGTKEKTPMTRGNTTIIITIIII